MGVKIRYRTCAVGICFAVLALAPQSTAALDHTASDLYVRVVDVGAGLCTVTVAPGGHYMVYDAGDFSNKNCLSAVEELVPAGETIDLMVLSHSDADHIGNGADILKAYEVETIIHTGNVRTTQTWKELNKAIKAEARGGAENLNLRDQDIEPGTEFDLGGAKATFVAGWHEWTETNISSVAEGRNAISIVVRLTFRGQHILFG